MLSHALWQALIIIPGVPPRAQLMVGSCASWVCRATGHIGQQPGAREQGLPPPWLLLGSLLFLRKATPDHLWSCQAFDSKLSPSRAPGGPGCGSGGPALGHPLTLVRSVLVLLS